MSEKLSITAEHIEKVTTVENINGTLNVDAKDSNVTVIVAGKKEKKLEDLTFDDFSAVLDEFPENIQKLLRPLSSTINTKFTPKEIYEQHGAQLFLPEETLNNVSPQLWEGWLLFLIYIYTSNPSVNLGNYTVAVNENQIGIEFLYNEENKKFSSLIHDLLASRIYKAKKPDLFIFNNKRGSLIPNVLSNEERKRIIVDFTTANAITDEIFGSYKFSCLHLAAVTDKVGTCSENNLGQLKQEVKDKITEVLENVI